MGFDLDDYVDVAQRIALFREKHPEGSLRPFNPADPIKIVTINDKVFLLYVACAYRSPDDPSPGIGVAWEPFPGRTPYTRDSEAMNCESSAWGRAIVAALAADTKKIASADEVRNRQDRPPGRPVTGPSERAQVLARLYAITKKIEPDLADEDRQRWLAGETKARGLDGSNTADLIKLADQLEQVKA